MQTVTADANPAYHALIGAFRGKVGVPMILNTSINENEPIVRTALYVAACFNRTRTDTLVFGDCVISRRRDVARDNIP